MLSELEKEGLEIIGSFTHYDKVRQRLDTINVYNPSINDAERLFAKGIIETANIENESDFWGFQNNFDATKIYITDNTSHSPYESDYKYNLFGLSDKGNGVTIFDENGEFRLSIDTMENGTVKHVSMCYHAMIEFYGS